jgi:RNase H-like domain found in reverse transcriptase
VWEERHNVAFAYAKATLATAVPLAHPLPYMLLALATDASNTHIGGVLQQKVRGHWQPLGFFSRRLSATEANYSTFDRKLLAAQVAINHFLPQVEGRQFQLWTDNKPLVAAMTRVTPPALGRQQRYLAFIAKPSTCATCGTLLAWTTWWPTPCRGPQHPLPLVTPLCRFTKWQRRWQTRSCAHWI